ncbi:MULTISPECIES: helix-turn-helix domain-containing protein [Rhodomicrobium]|uniref:helix-turn-helix domain-containing protein n=1 Tax=Rhodomicrobium TaxID=1068 RepID=UPI0014821F9D|nr:MULTISPECIES: helix-turn-helix domain-containing protein [Rhodomicrobium]
MLNNPTAAIALIDADGLPNERAPDRLRRLLAEGRDELYRLYHIARQAGCELVVCDAQDIGGRETLQPAFETAGAVPEPNVVPVDFGKALRRRQVSLTDAAAPLHDADGNLVGRLDVRPFDRNAHEKPDALTRAILATTARAIEERAFRERYRGEYILAVSPSHAPHQTMLFVVDRCQTIIAADRHGRAMLAERFSELASRTTGISLWALFEKNPALLRPKDPGDIGTELVPVGSGQAWPALLTPPESSSPSWRSADRSQHARARLGAIVTTALQPTPPRASGGLPPSIQRRVCEHIDANLEARIELAELAEIANLSRCHFAYAFKRSLGETPHRYVMSRRLEKARALLAETEMPLAEIAIAAGFADQSHFSRCFRDVFGLSPSQFRRSQR